MYVELAQRGSERQTAFTDEKRVHSDQLRAGGAGGTERTSPSHPLHRTHAPLVQTRHSVPSSKIVHRH